MNNASSIWERAVASNEGVPGNCLRRSFYQRPKVDFTSEPVSPGGKLRLQARRPQFLRSLHRHQDESVQHNHYMKCNFPRLSSGGENESSKRTTEWKQEAPRAPESLSSTRCTMTSSGREFRMCKASARTKDRTSSGISEEFIFTLIAHWAWQQQSMFVPWNIN